MNMAYFRNLALFGAFIVGYFCPWASHLNWMIRWLIVGMMFMVMLQVRFSMRSIKWNHLYILLANVAVGMGGWGIFMLFGQRELAEVAFFTGITPTATAAPVIVGLLGERIDFAVSAFLTTNFGMACLFPFLIPVAIGDPAPTVFFDVIKSLLIVVGIPLLLAIPVRKFYKNYRELPKKLKNVSFFAWVIAIFLIIANASQFLRGQQGSIDTHLLWKIALLSAAICFVNFYFGRFIGGRRYRREASQVLGQKNTTLTIFLALTYANPLVALGPTFYVIWHNAWNACQLQMRAVREKRKRLRAELLLRPHGGRH